MLEVRNLHKAYRGGDDVLHGINFEVQPGEFVVILGQSGAGKSTLLRCLNYLCLPSGGEIRVNGVRHNPASKSGRQAQRRHFAMVFQDHNLLGRLSVLKNVLVGRMAHIPFWSCLFQVFSRRDVALALQAIETVGLGEKAYERADSLSGGQQQRVGIARALVQRPAMMLADEPVASLDPQSARQVLNCLQNACRRENIAVVCNLHQLDYAMEYASRVIGLAGGKVVYDGPPESMTPQLVEAIYPGVAQNKSASIPESGAGGALCCNVSLAGAV